MIAAAVIPPRIRKRPGRGAFLAATALIAIQPTLAADQGAVLALSDAFLIVAVIANLPLLPSCPPRMRIPVWFIGGALVVGWIQTTAFGDEASIAWATTRLGGFFLLAGYLFMAHQHGADQNFVRTALRAFVYLTTAVNVLLLNVAPTQEIMRIVLPVKFPSRLSGGLFDPNANGTVLACCLMLTAFGGSLVARHLVVRCAFLLVISYCLVQTFSRGAFVAVVVAVLVVGVVSFRRRPGLLFGAAVATIAIYTVFDAVGVVSAVQTNFEARPDSSLGNRVFYVTDAVEAFYHNPFFGTGLGSATERNGAIVHFSLFWLLGDVGILGGLGFVAFALSNAKIAIELVSSRVLVGVAASLIVQLVASLSIEALYQRHWWIILGFALAALNSESRDTT